LLEGLPEPRRADAIVALQHLVDALDAPLAVPLEETTPE
jgi:hypothetical protein